MVILKTIVLENLFFIVRAHLTNQSNFQENASQILHSLVK